MSLAHPSSMITIVIADDEPTIVELIRLTLEDDRVRVFEAHDGQGALALASMLHPDLIFLDVHMPDLTGLDVCRALREDESFKTTRIVMLTAAAQAEDVARGLAAGADHYLTKPFSPLRLLSLVETLVPRAVSWQPDTA
jgi:DNA-binding response OmpR family regulator